MESRVTQSLRGELLNIWRWDTTTEGAELSVARIIEQDQQHVWRALGRTHHLRKGRWVGILVGPANLSLETKVGPWQRLRRGRGWNRGRGLLLGRSRLREKPWRNECRQSEAQGDWCAF